MNFHNKNQSPRIEVKDLREKGLTVSFHWIKLYV